MLRISLLIVAVKLLFLLPTAEAMVTPPKKTNKAGIAWPDGLDLGFSRAFSAEGHDLWWWWNWSVRPGKGFETAVPPGDYAGTMFDEGSHANEMPVGSAVIAFNEPDKCGGGQSCMIKDGDIANLKESMPGLVDNWVKAVVPLIKDGRQVGSPAFADDTVKCLTEFFDVCKARPGCKLPTFIAMHAYVTSAEELKNLVTEVHNAFNLPIWLTEFACHSFRPNHPLPTEQMVHSFMGATTKWLDEQPFVQRYSWLGAGLQGNLGGVNEFCRLQDDDGKLTNLGWQYVYRRHD